MPEIPFIGGSYSGRTTDINSQRSINQYPYIDQQEGKTVLSMVGTPGLVEYGQDITVIPTPEEPL